jgi:hypothetical protein
VEKGVELGGDLRLRDLTPRRVALAQRFLPHDERPQVPRK